VTQIVPKFNDVIKTSEQLHEILGQPSKVAAEKAIPALDHHCRDFIERSPFLLIATADANGSIDVSPKGDPAGFVQILDNNMIAIPDRKGNRRADTFSNILENPKVGLFFYDPQLS
jgi:predicted pyridoxine 5'-phosphate oxidase superfamily flavin-nucleotide-binding protein